MARLEKLPTFASEAELCASFAAAVTGDGWTAYPETSGWDLLLVRDGIQVGVQAKLKANLDVLAQATRYDLACGPHYAAVLVPNASRGFMDVTRACRLIVISPHWRQRSRYGVEDKPQPLPEWGRLIDRIQHVPPLHFDMPEWVPPDVPDLPAGVPSPVQLTAWKYQALRLLVRLEVRGYVTGKDFAEIGLNRSRWYHHWLIPADGDHRPERWVRAANVRLADNQHPEIFAPMVQAARETISREAEQSPLSVSHSVADQATLDLRPAPDD